MKTKSYGKLTPLPLGKIRPEGWLKEQLLRCRDGMGGHLDELEPEMIAYPYVDSRTNDDWGQSKAGWGAEISGNYWYGLMMLAFTLDDDFLKEKAHRWVEGVLKNQKEDGYMGTYTDKDDKWDDYNAWGTNCGMRAMLAYYEATGREDVLEAVHRCMLWFCENWAGDRKTRYAGESLVESMSLTYLYTGDSRLVTFIDEYIDFQNRNDLYLISQDAMRNQPLVYNSSHAAGYVSDLWIYAAAYLAGGNVTNLEAAENGVAKLYPRAMQRTGGVPCYAEYLSPVSASVDTEYCAFAFLQSSLGYITAASGNPQYTDLIERIVFNGAQGSRMKNERAIAYMSAPNQLNCTEESCTLVNDMHLYAPVYPIACCPVTSTWVMPGFVRNMAYTGEDGLYIAAYGPASMDFGSMRITAETAYPFRDRITFRISAGAPVSETIQFRVPLWCRNASFAVNGTPVNAAAVPGTWCAVPGEWKDGDTVEITFPMTVDISRVDDSDACSRFPMAVEYGPLLFAFPVPQKWHKWKNRGKSPLPEGWDWWGLTGAFTPDPTADQYEQNGTRKFDISWNIAIDEALDPAKVKVELCEEGGYVWETPQIRLRLPGYKALYSYPPYHRQNMDLYTGPVDVQMEQELELVPFGCTNLRIAYIPRAKLPMAPLPSYWANMQKNK